MERKDYVRALHTEHKSIGESPTLTPERVAARQAAIRAELAKFGETPEGVKPLPTGRASGRPAERA